MNAKGVFFSQGSDDRRLFQEFQDRRLGAREGVFGRVFRRKPFEPFDRFMDDKVQIVFERLVVRVAKEFVNFGKIAGLPP